MFFKKINTLKKIYNSVGIEGIYHVLKKKFINQSDYKLVAKYSLNYLKNNQLEVYKNLSDAVSYVMLNEVKGDICEFGVMTGRSSLALITSTDYYNQNFILDNQKEKTKDIYFFDSFEGLPSIEHEIDRSKPLVKDGSWVKSACKGLTKKEFSNLMLKNNKKTNFYVYEGWFNETLKKIDYNKKFCLIHIDSDLYQSAIDVLDNLFSKKQISKGAIILFDDYNCNYASKEMGERKAWSEIVKKYEVETSSLGYYSYNCKKFTIHNYK
jgi:O-methyltransferase